MERLKTNSYGKINLMLNISGVRDDGYHTLETVMQTVSLHDTIEIRFTKKQGISLKCSLPYVPSDERNIAWKAAEKFMAASGVKRGMEIDIKKTIPVGGGMGGGSANAASVLTMLNKMTDFPLSQEKMDEIALSLGADVPFCMRRGAYLAEGIGEKLTQVGDMPKCFIVVCKPKASVSSKTAYGVYDEYKNKNHFDSEAMVRALNDHSFADIAAAVGNSFEEPIAALHSEIMPIKKKLLDSGAAGAAMTGSGSVVFGLFEDAPKAHLAKAALRMAGYRTFCVKPVTSKCDE